MPQSPSKPSSTVAARQPPSPRRRGRPPKTEAVDANATTLISREQIIERAVQLAKVEPLSELSIIGLAREFGVAPSLIHYYIGSRDELISGVVNEYYRARVERLAPRTGDWRRDIEDHAWQSYALMLEHGGVLRYVMSHNRFRLFQQTAPGQADYGLVYLDRVSDIFRDGGFTAEQSAMGYHLLAQFTMASAHAQVSRQLPADHGKFIKARIDAVPQDRFPGAHFIATAFTQIDSDSAFGMGLGMLLDGMEQWRQQANTHKR